MSKRTLPTFPEIHTRERVRFDLPETARAKFNASIRAAADESTINVYGPIGGGASGAVTDKSVAAALAAIGSRDVTVNVNSPGGDAFMGIAIYNLLRAHPGSVTVRIVGLAASAASIVAMAGDEIQIGKAAFVMIHDVWVLAIGNRHDMRELADWLEPFDTALAALYAARTGKTKDEIAALMDAETWLPGEAAVEQGFADALLPADALEETESTSGVDNMSTKPEIDSAVAEAVKAERERSKAIMALPETKGREKVAQVCIDQGMTAEQAKTILAAAPRSNMLTEAMAHLGTPGIRAEETPDGDQLPRGEPAEDFKFRESIFASAARKTH